MRSFFKRNLNGIVLMALLCAQMAMVGQQARTAGQTVLSYWTGKLVLPLQSASRATVGAVSGAWERYVWLVRTEQENRRLDSEADRFKIENYFLRQELRRYQAETEVAAYVSTLASRTLGARVIGTSPDRAAKEAYLDRGAEHGVKLGMAVVTPRGIVGKIQAVYQSSSMVAMITDSEAGVGVVLEDSGEPAVLRGTNSAACRLEYVGGHVRVAVGEFVYTSGQDGIYPLGLPVGQVSWIRSGVKTHEVAVMPFARLGRLSEVVVLLDSQKEALPERLQRSLAQFPRTVREGAAEGQIQVESAGIDADRVKLAYRRLVDAQQKRVGDTSGRPVDFTGVPGQLQAGAERPPGGGAGQ